MDEMDNRKLGQFSNGADPQMAGSLLTSLIVFLQHDEKYNNSGLEHQLIKQMLYQTMNHIVRYGWNQSRAHHPYDYFVYSEAMPETRGSPAHLLFPLAYLYREFHRDLERGTITNPEKITTVEQWKAIVTHYHENLSKGYFKGAVRQDSALPAASIVNHQYTGFYGYEFIWPADFFTLANDPLFLKHDQGPRSSERHR